MSEVKCNFCGVSKATTWLLNVHIRAAHTKDNNYFKCYFCFRSIRGSKLESHIGGHTEERPYMCHFKCKAYKWKSCLLRHYKNYHCGFKINTKPISLICYFCGRSHKTSFLLEDHLRAAHTYEKPFKCDIFKCVRTFSTSGYKNKHVIINCAKNPHRRKVGPNTTECYFCDVRLSRKHFHFHINGHTGEKHYKCLHCNLWFSRPVNRKRHIIAKHKMHLHHKCSFCGVSRVTLVELNTHIQRVHTKDGKKLKCYFCEKEFSHMIPNSHMVMHTNEFHHKCKYCHAQYRSSQQLKYHYFKKHPELVDARKIKSQFTNSCEICGDKFYTSELLLSHVRKHQRTNKYDETEAISRKKNRGVPISKLIGRAYRNCKVVQS